MAVKKNDRGESVVQFLDTARQLEEYTLDYCMKFPKRYTFFLSLDLVKLSKDIYNNAKAANSVYPQNSEEAQIRINYVIYAIVAAEQLASQLDVAMNRIHEFAKTDKDGNPKPIKVKVWEEWARLVSTEIRLLKALKKSLQGKYNIKE